MQLYPLAWPVVYPRTKPHKRNDAQFPTSFQQARWDLLGELMRFHAEDIILSTNLRLNENNEPIYDHEPDDPGVAVWFKIRVVDPADKLNAAPDAAGSLEQMAIACDCWATVHLNIGALAATMMGLRGMYRFGTTHVLDSLLSGLKVPPEADISPEDTRHHRRKEPTLEGTPAGWWHVLGFTHPAEASLEEAEKRYRDRVKQAHPDRGGTDEAMRIFNEAIEQAREHFAPTGEQT